MKLDAALGQQIQKNDTVGSGRMLRVGHTPRLSIGNSLFRGIIKLVLCVSLLVITGCSQYYLSVSQQWLDVDYLASSHVATPDPRQLDPPLGQMLVLSWRLPEAVFVSNPRLILDLILWDYTTTEVSFPIERRMDFTTYRLVNQDYDQSGGILTYKARILTDEGILFREWKHQLWTPLILITD